MTIISKFREIVKKHHNNIALISEIEGSMSYNQLNEYSNYIANELLSCSDEGNAVIGVLLNRSFELIATMLGVMKAGKSYLPLDPNYPVDRLNWMMFNSKASKVICNNITKSILKDNSDLIIIADLNGYSESDIDLCRGANLACVLYTSGSTGMPNGVLMSHEAIMNTLNWAINYYELSTNDVTLQIPSCSFTSSVQDIFTTLLSGGKLVLLDESKLLNVRYLKMISDKYSVTHFDMVPSLYKEYLRIIRNTGSLRFVLLAGEPLSINIVQEHFKKLPNVRLFNEYGMAETCSCSFVKEINSTDKAVSIGKPIRNIAYKINEIDQDGIGELFISGKGLATGYLNNPEYTKENFLTINDIRYLKTGDFVKEEANGELFYVCRKDNQIKVNGKRVNLSEIDFVLQSDELIIDSITTSIFYNKMQFIVSFVIAEKDDQYCLNRVKELLPLHYIPNFVKIVDDFCYLPNKKVDIKNMKEIFMIELDAANMKSDDKFKRILKVISNVSKGLLNDPDIDMDLRQQGIDSISFIRLLADVEEEFNFEFGYDDIDNLNPVSVKTLFDYIKQLT